MPKPSCAGCVRTTWCEGCGRRVILVTGAASGIGAATCRALAAPGVGLLVHTRKNRAGAEHVAEAVRASGAEVEVALGDLADPTVAGTLVAQAVDAIRRP